VRINLSKAEASELLTYLEGKPRLDLMRQRLEVKLAAAAGEADKLTPEELEVAAELLSVAADTEASADEQAVLSSASRKLCIMRERMLEREDGQANRV
jgi:hypothetical protein